MKRTFISLVVWACLGTLASADDPQQAFVKSWKGQPVVVRSVLYSLIYNERGKLGTTRRGQRDGLLVATTAKGEHLQFDGRQGRQTIVARDPERLVKAVHAEYEANTLDVRSYRKLEPLAIHRFEPGVELVVSDVRIKGDEVTLEFRHPDGTEPITSIRVKWALPISPSFSERGPVEDLLRRFVVVKQEKSTS